MDPTTPLSMLVEKMSGSPSTILTMSRSENPYSLSVSVACRRNLALNSALLQPAASAQNAGGIGIERVGDWVGLFPDSYWHKFMAGALPNTVGPVLFMRLLARAFFETYYF